MIAWLRRHPAAGCEQSTFVWMHGGPAFVQYWRSFEAVYGNMPAVGLAALGRHAPVGSTAHTAPQRMGTVSSDTPPIEPY